MQRGDFAIRAREHDAGLVSVQHLLLRCPLGEFAKSLNTKTITLLMWALIAQMPFYMTGNITVDVDGDIEFSLPRLQTDPAVIFSLSTYKGTDMLGLEFNGVAWGVGDIGDTMIPYTNGMRNITSTFACQPATTCRNVVNNGGHGSEVPTC